MIKNPLSCLVLIIATIIGGIEPGFADEMSKKKPLWELGLFNSAMTFPHYRGSDEQMYYVLAIPYFVYRGEVFKADRDGLKGIFYKTDKFETSVSLSGYPPVNGDTEARAGMPDLGALFGAGPELRFYVNDRKASNPVYLSTSVHGVSSMDYDSGLRIAYEGLEYRAHLIYRNTTLIGRKGSFFGINAGVYYADSGLNSYFYDVEPEYVRPGRPFYRSERGHSGHSVHSYLIYKLTDVFSLGFFGRWDNVAHAVYSDSPLVKQKDTYIGGISLIWKIAESRKMVEAE
ncbi:MAG: MipA/OmpV family protein [Proteobacteria bacterium]|nr:MipA/OmpV family protein [Pseudomonadota bacterium]MBU1736507.1 MipA/OmpV family protein [Pseudomonadota bacterium]